MNEEDLAPAVGPAHNTCDYISWNDAGDMESAIEVFTRVLPGWWFRIGLCSSGPYCSVEPDVGYPDKVIAERFAGGFFCDLERPATMADALLGATRKAREALDL